MNRTDEGQYRSAIFYHDMDQKEEALNLLAEMSVTPDLLEDAGTFYPAEEYHQNYYNKMSFGMFR